MSSTRSPTGLPTPLPSSEIQAKSNPLAQGIDASFSLPPAAISSNTPNTRTSSITSSNKSTSEPSQTPLSPPQPAPTKPKQTAGSKRKSSSASAMGIQEYALPPPPTRSRKIIQMKPKQGQESSETILPPGNTASTGRKSQPVIAPAPPNKGLVTAQAAPAPATPGSKKRQSSSGGPTTAAGRKMARKTAHSLIERRRRSKMNEEFGVLKDMIPACTGQDMHKLAILQASIEYMRYLEKCLADLKAIHGQCPRPASNSSGGQVGGRSNTTTPLSQDTEVQELPPIRQAISSHSSSYTRLPSISPAILPLSRYNSAQTSPYHGPTPYLYPLPSGSALPSPVFEARHSSHSNQASLQLSSPAVSPTQMPEDHEATAALLMLNTDRRSWSEQHRDQPREAAGNGEAAAGARVFSVRDLLT
jgi:Helix-loop-helix DNA-binding domain